MQNKITNLPQDHRLRRAYEHCNEKVLPVLNSASAKAKKSRFRYRIITAIAIFFGTIALTATVVILLLPKLGLQNFLEVATRFEFAISLVVALIVILGLKTRIQHDWLENRNVAELARFLIFRALIHPILWCHDDRNEEVVFEQWKVYVDGQLQEIQKVSHTPLTKRIINEITFPPRPADSKCRKYYPGLRDLVAFYETDRIGVQMQYYLDHSEILERKDRWIRYLPPLLFFIGTLAVFGHVVFDASKDLFHTIPFPWENVAVAFLFLALLCPIIVAAIRTLRSSFEIGRSAALFRAKSIALGNIQWQITDEMAIAEQDGRKILSLLWDTEIFLDSEMHEWLRLMQEAEWFL